MRKVNISVLVSGGGTNFQALIDACERGDIDCGQIVQVIASNDAAYALTRAKNHGIRSRVIGKKTYPDSRERTEAIIAALKEENTGLVVLAGGETESGATVHFVDEGVDTGEIILQKTVPVLPEDTAETLAARVLTVEHEILPQAVKQLCRKLSASDGQE